uniref:Secreted protein n=1 Tax=Poecilia latipinna TaxID=48699 RepID=A0A3B3TYB3_9TELE
MSTISDGQPSFICALLELTLFAPVFCASSQRTCLRSFRISSESAKRDPSQTIRWRCSDVSQFPLRWFHSFRTDTVRNSARSPTAAAITAQNRESNRSPGGSLCLRAVRKVSGSVLLVCVRSRRRVKASRNRVNSSRRKNISTQRPGTI